MSVIIRLQNLPWTANARDIRNFFTGLSIPEGGVHIIGGEMGDAFIAFSTDEDARCAMLKDREKLMEVQVRLLLSSRAEMQKVIETARKVSVAAAASAAAVAVAAATPTSKSGAAASASAVSMPPVPQPPIIGGLNSFLLGQQQLKQQQQQLTPAVAAAAAALGTVATPSFLAYQQQAGISLADVGGLKAEKPSSELALFGARRRHSRSRSRSRSSSSDDSDRSHDRATRDRGRKRRSELRGDSSERELKMLPKPQAMPIGAVSNLLPWALGASAPPAAAPAAAALAPPAVNLPGLSAMPGLPNMPGLQQQMGIMSVLPPVLQSYSTTSNVTTNNYNLNLAAAPQQQQQQQQQQLAMMADLGQPKNQVAAAAQQQSEPIAFANVNPYAQMYPQLFQQQQQLLLQQQTAKTAPGMANSPGSHAAAAAGGGSGGVGGNNSGGGGVSGAAGSLSAPIAIAETCYIKISGMCPSTSYSDLRKYFAGLYIPHNGIKIVNGANGTRTGIAYVEFSRVSSAQKALLRNNTMFRDRLVQIVPISDEEFEQADERAQRHSGGGGGGGASRGDERASSVAAAVQQTNVLYVEDLPQLTTEQDIMKMFSATCTIVDILLAPSPNNRREFVAFVLFARENEARSALEDASRHYIGFRKLRVRASSQAEMLNAREKMRRASEQLQKEEQQQREDAEREQQNNGPNNSNGMNMMNNSNMGPFGGGMPPNNQQMQQQQQQQQQLQGHPRRQEDVFVRVHNCEYATRINDLGELFVSENLRIEHIEMLFNERNQSAGEFIVEFADPLNAKIAIREFHNRRFRGRGLRLTTITPQEIADRMNKPFMDYLPGGNGPRQVDAGDALSSPIQQQQPQQQQQQQQSSRRRGASRFDDASNRGGNGGGGNQSQLDSDDSSNSKQHFNPFAKRAGPELGLDELGGSSPMLSSSIKATSKNGGGSDGVPEDDGIPDKFNRAGCVVAMRNVPFKADLKDILRFFNDYKLSPDDIIRRFNDDGKPTGDARVAFESPSEARSAFESKRRKQIFNRTVYLDII
ncbi:uncharacterized protein LOC135432679 isoform X3 [Drosophila montana]|uniref:uncharacterized protein LOC135432679 isoform X3 n=1 Tax=Drosophila montana TaxID=40370 RepID=UPI00313BA463